MKVRTFLCGVAIGLLIAPGDAPSSWRRARNWLARTIDAVLQIGTAAHAG